MYRVFLGAPTKDELEQDPHEYNWKTVTSNALAQTGSTSISAAANVSALSKSVKPWSGTQPARENSVSFGNISINQFYADMTPSEISISKGNILEKEQSREENKEQTTNATQSQGEGQSRYYILPPATLEAANSRISMVYRNIIFGDDRDEGGNEDADEGYEQRGDETTMLTWPPTALDQSAYPSGPSFLQISKSHLISTLKDEAQFNTSDATSDSEDEMQSYAVTGEEYSNASSIARFPTFHFLISSLTSLSALSQGSLQFGATCAVPTPKFPSFKINIVVAVLEVEGPDQIRAKQGPDAGKELSILKLILGDEEGNVCKLTAWRTIAEIWGGVSGKKEDIGVKKGDVVMLQGRTFHHL